MTAQKAPSIGSCRLELLPNYLYGLIRINDLITMIQRKNILVGKKLKSYGENNEIELPSVI